MAGLRRSNNPEGRPRSSIGDRLAKLYDRRGDDECWPWTGFITPYGYGRFWKAKGQAVHAHRAVYEVFIGPIPEGLDLDHVKDRGCISKACVNPAHLEPVTNIENNRRSDSPSAVNARKDRCQIGHAFTAENTYLHPNGSRQCRTCRREGARILAAQRKAARHARGLKRSA